MRWVKIVILLLPTLTLFLLFKRPVLAETTDSEITPTLIPSLSATASPALSPTIEVTPTLVSSPTASPASELTPMPTPSSEPSEEPTPETPPPSSEEKKEKGEVLGIFSPGQAILAGLIVLALICGLACFGLDSFRRTNQKAKEKKV